MILELLFDLWNSVPDAGRYAAAEYFPLIVYILRAAAAATGGTLYEDLTIGN